MVVANYAEDTESRVTTSWNNLRGKKLLTSKHTKTQNKEKCCKFIVIHGSESRINGKTDRMIRCIWDKELDDKVNVITELWYKVNFFTSKKEKNYCEENLYKGISITGALNDT